MRTIAGTTWRVEDAQAYIMARVKADENGCWIWQRALCRKGYGRFTPPASTFCGMVPVRIAHRLAYDAFVGPIAGKLFVCHRCDVPACCNPKHLWLGTNAENMADMSRKGRTLGESNKSSTLTEEMVRAILVEPGSQRAIARKFGISQQHVSVLRRGLLWPHVTRGGMVP